MSLDEVIVCTCAEISKQTIIDAVKKLNSSDISLICDETGAGQVCGGCRPVIQEIIKTGKK